MTNQQTLTLTATPAETPDPAQCYLTSLSPGSRRSVGYALDALALFLSSGHRRRQGFCWERLCYPDVVRARAWLVDTYSPSAAARGLCILKGVLREAFRLDLLALNDHIRIREVRSIPVRREPCGRRLTMAEAERLNQAAEPGAGGDRDRALIWLLLATGVRRSELVGLDIADVRQDDRTIHVRDAKRGARRWLPLPARCWAPLVAWIGTRGAWPGPLLTPMDQRGAVVHKRLAPNSVNFILGRLGGRACVARFSPHDARRTAVSGLLDAGLDLFETARFAGHRSVSTTAIYDLRGDEALRAAVSRYLDDPSPAGNVLQQPGRRASTEEWRPAIESA